LLNFPKLIQEMQAENILGGDLAVSDHELERGEEGRYPSSLMYQGGGGLDAFLWPGSHAAGQSVSEARFLFMDFDDTPFVTAGENWVPPSFPKAEEFIEDFSPFGNLDDYMNAIMKTPALVWSAPDGNDYRLFDLYWDHGFTVGYQVIKVCPAFDFDYDALCERLAAMTGHPMEWSHRHL